MLCLYDQTQVNLKSRVSQIWKESVYFNLDHHLGGVGFWCVPFDEDSYVRLTRIPEISVLGLSRPFILVVVSSCLLPEDLVSSGFVRTPHVGSLAIHSAPDTRRPSLPPRGQDLS